MRRREFTTLLGSAVAAWPLTALAKASPKRPLIAWFSSATQAYSAANIGYFLQGMRELDYIEGTNLDMVYRFSDGYQDRLPTLAAEIVSLKPDVILATAIIGAVAARKATSTIPIVSPALADAVQLGLIASVARPSGNVTGIMPYVDGLPGKQMEFAREIVPGIRSIGLLANVNDPKAPPQMQEMEAAGVALGIKVVTADASRPDDIDGALQELASQQVEVVIVLQTSMLLSESRQIAASALVKRLPTVYGYREHVVAGGLISYGVDLRWCFHRAATLVHHILSGTAPGDVPVEFPTKLVMVVNLKVAKELGLTISPTLLIQADEVIQ